MTRSTFLKFIAGAAAISLTALALAACGGSSTGGSGNATVGLSTTGAGKVLVDSHGHTLYLFKKDSGTASNCAGACAAAWPPLRANGMPTAGSGAQASLVSTTKRSDGAPQVTYNGHPLYLYAGDEKPGDTHGQGLTDYGAAWYALGAAGKQVTAMSSTADGYGASSYGGGGSGY
jgi:predicted lipoprotein with Yx(FWY)xxD motif